MDYHSANTLIPVVFISLQIDVSLKGNKIHTEPVLLSLSLVSASEIDFQSSHLLSGPSHLLFFNNKPYVCRTAANVSNWGNIRETFHPRIAP